MDIIYIRRDEIDHLINFSDIRKVSTPLTYNRAYDVDKYTRLELSVYFMFQDGMLLVRNLNRSDKPGIIPSTELLVPPVMNKSDVFETKQSFCNVLEWNVAYALSRICSRGYVFALGYGSVSMPDMLHYTLSVSLLKTEYGIFNMSFEGEWLGINCYMTVTDIEKPEKFAYVDYKSFERYYKYKEANGEEFLGHRTAMEKYSPIYSNNDHRISKSDIIWNAIHMQRYSLN